MEVIEETREAKALRESVPAPSKGWKCMYCGAGKKNGNDPLYCSGKCRMLDGAEALETTEVYEITKEADLVTPEEIINPEPTETPSCASLEDYLCHPERYHRRVDPEKLNWDEPLSAPDLKQCGFRANRKPVRGDWDYEE